MNQAQRRFIATVYDFYHTKGRHDLPWRQTTDPYHIAVSEIMLQQTQVERVIPKYEAFVKQWPSARALARADLGEVLIVWQGLGYNRRAKALWEMAQVVATTYRGTFPRTVSELVRLPGIGPYTAGAIMAFAYNEAVPLIETNIRTVYLYHFFKHKDAVSDTDILLMMKQTLDHEHPREWYAALMDYGSYLKSTVGNVSKKSRHYTKQTAFKGSNRHARGYILRLVTEYKQCSISLLQSHRPSEISSDQLEIQISALLQEGLILSHRGLISLPRVNQ